MSLPSGRALGPGQISKLDQDLFARVAKRISDTSKRKEYREKSNKSLRSLITVLTKEVQTDQANSPAVRQVLGKRRDRLLKKPLAVPTNDCFNKWKSDFVRLNELTTGTAHKSNADLATVYYNKVAAISSELSTRLWTEVRLTNATENLTLMLDAIAIVLSQWCAEQEDAEDKKGTAFQGIGTDPSKHPRGGARRNDRKPDGKKSGKDDKRPPARLPPRHGPMPLLPSVHPSPP